VFIMSPETTCDANSLESVIAWVIGDCEEREKRGERPDPKEYEARFPAFASEIRGYFAVVRLLGPAGGRMEAPAPVAGRRVGNYELLEEIASGGMGVVYKALQKGLPRVHALKMLKAGALASEVEKSRFRREVETLARLEHPNIIPIYQVGEQDEVPYFSMEFCPGGDLASRLDGAPLPAEEAAEVVRTLAGAMHVAHLAGVVHRDLKPGNVLLVPQPPGASNPGATPARGVKDFILKITDFGLAKKLDETDKPVTITGKPVTITGAVMGTPQYMAPEQALGEHDKVGPHSDVYSLGVILYELLTGRPPLRADTPLNTLLLVIREDPVPPSHLQPGLPRDVEAVCLKCLQKAKENRYDSAAALADDLGRFLRGEPTKARPVTSFERAVKYARRRPAHAVAAGALVLALLGGIAGGVFYGLYQRAIAVNERHDREAVEARVQRGQAAAAEWKQGLEDEQAGRPGSAKEHLVRALATVDPEADPDFRSRIEQDLERVNKQLEVLARRQDWEKRRKRFDEVRREVLLHEINFTERDRDANRDAIRQAAPAALAAFRLTLDEAPKAATGHLEDFRPFADPPRQVDEAAADCYEVLLVWAEAEAPPEANRAAVGEDGVRKLGALLDLAAALGEAHHLPIPQAFHLRHARYLALCGNEDGARAERDRAQRRQPDTPLDLFLTALDSYRQENFARAAEACDGVLRRKHDHFWAQYLAALCSLKTGDWKDARTGMIACLGREPRLYWAWLQLATAEGQLGQFDAAENDFAEALRQTDDPVAHFVALTNRGAMWVQRRRWPEAEADLSRAIDLQRKAPEGYLNLAQMYRQREKQKGGLPAIDASTLGLLAAPSGQGPLLAASALFPGRADWDAELEVLNKALTQLPNDAHLHHTRAVALLEHGDLAAARQDFEEAIRQAPEGTAPEWLATDHVELAYLQRLAGEFPAALESCKAALRIRPGYAPAYLRRAETLLAQAEAGERAAGVYPSPYLRRAETTPAEKLYSQARDALDLYLGAVKPKAGTWRARGVIDLKLRQYEDAVDDFGSALNIERDGKTLSLRGWAYLNLNAFQLARRDFDAALQLEPTDIDALSGRGFARVCLGERPAGLKDADAALANGQGTPEQMAELLIRTACTYARAAGQPTGRSVSEWQERAVDLVRSALEKIPQARRLKFWQVYVANEPELRSILDLNEMRELKRRYVH
jgi:tetratricopeptide (TPR) repeat protein